MILDAINDVECLGQLTKIARELAPTTLVGMVARRLGSCAGVIRWIQSLPQANDEGMEQVRFIQCDVPQRIRLLPDDPNCVERSLGALMLFEVLDPKTPRALATVDRPLRHTGLVEKVGAHWRAVDLFPRRNAARNFDWGETGKDVLQGLHTYVGKPILSFYGAGSVADTLGNQENKLIGRDKKKESEKKAAPPTGSDKSKGEQPKPQAGSAQPRRLSLAQLVGAGASTTHEAASRGGGEDAQEAPKHDSSAAAGRARATGSPKAGDGDSGHSHDEEAGTQRWWFLHR
jgi:hypothetical protein